jgi:hypothetical protein
LLPHHFLQHAVMDSSMTLVLGPEPLLPHHFLQHVVDSPMTLVQGPPHFLVPVVRLAPQWQRSEPVLVEGAVPRRIHTLCHLPFPLFDNLHNAKQVS